MSESILQSSAWYNAMTLVERIASLSKNRSSVTGNVVNNELAQKRLERWKSQPPFSTNSCFARRLQMDGITEEELWTLLGEPAKAVKDRFSDPPAWMPDFLTAFSEPTPFDPLPLPEMGPGLETVGFLGLIEPLLIRVRKRLREGLHPLIQAYKELPFDPNTIVDLLFVNLPWKLFPVLSRTMILELNVTRLEGHTTGDTPEERFKSFITRIRQPDVAFEIFQEYPIMARHLWIRTDQWVRFGLEFLSHLCSDWEEIKARFSPDNHPGAVAQVQGGAGDTHRDGRSVMVIKFASGFQIVYKPHSLGIDVHFNDLLAWLNARGNHPPFRTLKVLDRRTHGWVEFIQNTTCTSEEEIRRFYERQGAYLALFYALEATDFHFENLLASGEHPIPVDLESLFHPRESEGDNKQSDMIAFSAMWHSVVRVGLLPQLIWGNAEYEGIDISGLGALGGQLTPDRLPQVEGGMTDEMRIVRKRLEMPPGRNRPTLNDTEINALDYAEDIYAGFKRMYRLLMFHTNELLSPDGILSSFADDEIRMIARPTRLYYMYLYESFHPDFLRNALDSDQLYDRLWIGIENRPVLVKLIPSELQDIHRSEVPFFSTRPNSMDIWDSSGKEIAGFFEESGFDLVRRRFLSLSEEDLNRQIWFIRSSLATLAMGTDREQKVKYAWTEPATSPTRGQLSERLLNTASAVGNRLDALALRGDDDASWLGLSPVGENRWFLAPMGFDVYSGLPGVVLFFAYLQAVTREDRYSQLAKAALITIRRQIEDRKKNILAIGAYDGWSGVIYTLTHLSALWNDPALLEEAEVFVRFITPELIERDESLDIIGGSAGCIGCMVAYNHFSPSSYAVAAAIQCGDHLIARSKSMQRGIGWPSRMTRENEALTGFSHGAAGMAWALLELFSVTGNERFRKAAFDAMEYERSVFSSEVCNWPDLRDFDQKKQPPKDSKPSFMSAWCHGAPGIGLGRLSSYRHYKDEQIKTEIELALKTTLEKGFGTNHSLCHGGLGNIETLLYACEKFDPSWRKQVDRFSVEILDSIEKNSWLCGVPLGTETPGLMCGLAGIGYELLRLAEPKKVPSVLILEPPILKS